jgi:hypothetical protein
MHSIATSTNLEDLVCHRCWPMRFASEQRSSVITCKSVQSNHATIGLALEQPSPKHEYFA